MSASPASTPDDPDWELLTTSQKQAYFLGMFLFRTMHAWLTPVHSRVGQGLHRAYWGSGQRPR